MRGPSRRWGKRSRSLGRKRQHAEAGGILAAALAAIGAGRDLKRDRGGRTRLHGAQRDGDRRRHGDVQRRLAARLDHPDVRDRAPRRCSTRRRRSTPASCSTVRRGSRSTPANCDALWYYIPGSGQSKVTESELTFAVDGGSPPPPDGPVVLIVFENRPYSQIAGHAPYLNGLAAQGQLFTHDIAIVHPSLPNYMTFTAGSTLGCTTDYHLHAEHAPGGEPVPPARDRRDLAGTRSPSTCRPTVGLNDSGSVPNKYIAHHNPVVYFTNVHAACLTKSKPYSQIDPVGAPAVHVHLARERAQHARRHGRAGRRLGGGEHPAARGCRGRGHRHVR